MSHAFEISSQDIENVLGNYGVKLSDEKLEEACDGIDDSAVADAALGVDFEMGDGGDVVMAKQIEAAYDEIAYQLATDGYITKAQIKSAGNLALLGLLEQEEKREAASHVIAVGDFVRSYDFKGIDNCYIEGTVERVGCLVGQPDAQGSHFAIKVERSVVEGVEYRGLEPGTTVYPPLNGQQGLLGKTEFVVPAVRPAAKPRP